MTIGVLKEPTQESRVSLLPEAAAVLMKKGLIVVVEESAGEKAFADDESFRNFGVLVKPRTAVIEESNIILSIHPPGPADLALAQTSRIFIGIYQPIYNPQLADTWASKGLTMFSLDLLPRITRAQTMDVLSSQANIAGYKAVLEAASLYSRYFPMFMTAAGTIAPAKVLVLGAGVAGLQAIATARRLGAVVEVFDARPAVKEEVMSLGAKFIQVEGASDASGAGGYAVEQTEEYKQRQEQRIAESIAKADIVISTAQIFGKKAPILVTAAMLNTMRNGSVIIDLAAATGGNTAFTKNDETVNYGGVTIVGNSHLPADMPSDASKLYGKNILNFLELIIDKNGQLHLNWEDEIVKGTCVTYNGEIRNKQVANSQKV